MLNFRDFWALFFSEQNCHLHPVFMEPFNYYRWGKRNVTEFWGHWPESSESVTFFGTWNYQLSSNRRLNFDRAFYAEKKIVRLFGLCSGPWDFIFAQVFNPVQLFWIRQPCLNFTPTPSPKPPSPIYLSTPWRPQSFHRILLNRNLLEYSINFCTDCAFFSSGLCFSSSPCQAFKIRSSTVDR